MRHVKLVVGQARPDLLVPESITDTKLESDLVSQCCDREGSPGWVVFNGHLYQYSQG